MSTPHYAFEEPGRYARGWHVLAFSRELQPGDIKSFRYFDQELVLFRGHSGKAVLVDAYCPHLGANLGGLGSEVIADTIRCPFHGWQFDASGSCVHIPYCESIPERARNSLKAWPVCEINGFIAVWHDHEGGEPEYALPEIPVWGPDHWGDWSFHRSTMNCQGRDIVENIVDVGHFSSVHGGKPQVFENFFDEHTVTQFSRITAGDPAETRMIIPRGLSYDLEVARAHMPPGVTCEGWATYHGPAIMYFFSENPAAKFPYRSWCLNCYTPIDNQQLDLVSAVIVAPYGDNVLPEEFLDMYPQIAHASVWQDVVIWQTRTYLRNPILCDGDGAIGELRKWYEQFYIPRGSC